MKINWGTGMVLVLLAFISFIMYFVVTMLTNKDYDQDLVVEDYYKAELHYQEDIDAEENAELIQHFLKSHPEFELTKEQQIYPFEHQTDGAYAAVLTRKIK